MHQESTTQSCAYSSIGRTASVAAGSGFLIGVVYALTNAQRIGDATVSIVTTPKEDVDLTIGSIANELLSDDAIVMVSALMTETGCEFFARLNDYSFSTRMRIRESFAVKAYANPKVNMELHLLCEENDFPNAEYALILERS